MDKHFFNSTRVNSISTRRPSLFTATLSALALTLSVGLMPVFAQDTVTTSTEGESSNVDSVSIEMLNTDEGLRITLVEIPLININKYYFDGLDITSLMSEMTQVGVIKTTESNGRHVLVVSLEQPILGEHTFAIETTDGTTISKKIILEQPVTDKGLGPFTVKGTLYTNCGWFTYGPALSQKSVTISGTGFIAGVPFKATTTTTNSMGNFTKDVGTGNSIANKIKLDVVGYHTIEKSATSKTVDFGKQCLTLK